VPLRYKVWIEEDERYNPDGKKTYYKFDAPVVSHNLIRSDRSGTVEPTDEGDFPIESELVAGAEFRKIAAVGHFRVQSNTDDVTPVIIHVLLGSINQNKILGVGVVLERSSTTRKSGPWNGVAMIKTDALVMDYAAPLRKIFHFNFDIVRFLGETDFPE
jgi:hypothetical protein